MQSFIKFEKIWNDDDIAEMKITVNNGHSSFSNKVYVGHNEFTELYESLNTFKTHYYGGLRNIEFGGFGCEYASGAFYARLHFPKPGNLFISTNQQSGFFEFKGQMVASESKMYLSTEPALFDNFLCELKALCNSEFGVAELICT
ncbi:hypothetical protein FP738_24290 [Vibrio parahaemolyticus]|uniref:hypothetical protein n=1 Tax=Vibrio TaxID=662 RepID=UPI001123C9CF|nr:hypothetical protein [Vibrio parahaemolyticus]EHH2484445.1 hypothetical protein [Vibrio parahaemolyticus]MCF9200142.1 hypothetical protein [Vibrio parahaemolyticus]NCO10073.1 hypothetical protein [Vibrio parahaemolyticus]TOI05101.1 hypothetical protein CGI68_23940 [Vibrio parahaemolyticus]HBC3988428.1 hypothetical protein [Vibrio parahaemolyticus]